MFSFIKFLKKNELLNDYRISGSTLSELPSLTKINFFVGANNSGKSRLLRYIATQFDQYPITKVDDTYSRLPGETKDPLALLAIPKEEVFAALQPEFEKLGNIQIGGKESLTLETLVKEDILDEYVLRNLFWSLRMLVKRPHNAVPDPHNAIGEMQQYVESKLPVKFGKRIRVTYVPIYRSLKKFIQPINPEKEIHSHHIDYTEFETLKQPLLSYRSLWDYFVSPVKTENSRDKIFQSTFNRGNIFTGEEIYSIVYNLRHGTEHKRKILTNFEKFLSTTFFNEQKVELNAISEKGIDNVYIKIGEEPEYPIHHLGDGIQAIIILTFPLFYHQDADHHVIVYEEPEIYLHPGMQRILIDALRSFNNVQAFIATHSNHFLDISYDHPEQISIFSLEKKLENNKPVFDLDNLSSPQQPLLDMLGVRNSSVFMANCCLWVEGISDRIYLKKFLELYIKSLGTDKPSFKEDLHYAFIEFGGNNIVHYNFSTTEKDGSLITAHKITNRIFLIHDQDKGKEARHDKLAEQLGDNYYMLDVLEMENLISPGVLKPTLNAYKYQGGEPLLFNDIKHEHYALAPFVEYVGALTDMTKVKKIFTPGSDTVTSKLYNKADFARTAVENMQSVDDLSASALNLTKKIYDFIAAHNAKDIR